MDCEENGCCHSILAVVAEETVEAVFFFCTQRAGGVDVVKQINKTYPTRAHNATETDCLCVALTAWKKRR